MCVAATDKLWLETYLKTHTVIVCETCYKVEKVELASTSCFKTVSKVRVSKSFGCCWPIQFLLVRLPLEP